LKKIQTVESSSGRNGIPIQMSDVPRRDRWGEFLAQIVTCACLSDKQNPILLGDLLFLLHMQTIASVTLLPVGADSRTFKISASFTGFGYRSIVTEGKRSNIVPTDLAFELFSNGAFGRARSNRADVAKSPFRKPPKS
jgi:hypothetical protein